MCSVYIQVHFTEIHVWVKMSLYLPNDCMFFVFLGWTRLHFFSGACKLYSVSILCACMYVHMGSLCSLVGYLYTVANNMLLSVTILLGPCHVKCWSLSLSRKTHHTFHTVFWIMCGTIHQLISSRKEVINLSRNLNYIFCLSDHLWNYLPVNIFKKWSNQFDQDVNLLILLERFIVLYM